MIQKLLLMSYILNKMKIYLAKNKQTNIKNTTQMKKKKSFFNDSERH